MEASVAPFKDSPSIPFVSSAKVFSAAPKIINSEAKSARDDSPVTHEVNLSNIPVPVRTNIADARLLIPFIVASSIFLTSFIKGFTLTQNSDIELPIAGRVLVAPCAIPAAIPPTN